MLGKFPFQIPSVPAGHLPLHLQGEAYAHHRRACRGRRPCLHFFTLHSSLFTLHSFTPASTHKRGAPTCGGKTKALPLRSPHPHRAKPRCRAAPAHPARTRATPARFRKNGKPPRGFVRAGVRVRLGGWWVRDNHKNTAPHSREGLCGCMFF